MATDGVKIIDSDTAHDIYSTFMDMYDEGVSIDILNRKYGDDKKLFFDDDEEYEICITTYALAFWEIGKLTSKMLQEVEKTIAKKATVAGWTIEGGEKLGQAREKVLEKFWTKINQPKEKPRKSKQYKKITEFIFEKGDILIFQNSGQKYCMTIVTNVIYGKGKCNYFFGRTACNSVERPEIQDIANIEFVGTVLGLNFTPHLFELVMEHKKLLKQHDNFLKIDNVPLKEYGNFYYESSINYEDFCNKFLLSISEIEDFKLKGRTIHKFNINELKK